MARGSCRRRRARALTRLRAGMLAVVLLALSATIVGRAPGAAAATLPPGFAVSTIAEVVAPTAMAFAPDGRLFVASQGGTVHVVKEGTLLPTPFLQLAVDQQGERGLVGIAFDPQFEQNQWVYVTYTAPFPVHQRVSRFTADGDVAAPGSEQILWDFDPIQADNHVAGGTHFGPDGKLYVAHGDNARPDMAQQLNSLLGKVIRINPDGTIPTDNPFVATTTGTKQAIWALGLRNPFTFAFQPGTGRMFINDVGQENWEEINEGVAGANYGWPITEGPTTDPRFRGPLFAYLHGASATTGCAITGGTFYNPPAATFPAEYLGTYFFADLCQGWIRRINPETRDVSDFGTAFGRTVDLDVSPDGDLYLLGRTGTNAPAPIQRITFAGQPTPAQARSRPTGEQRHRESREVAGATGSTP